MPEVAAPGPSPKGSPALISPRWDRRKWGPRVRATAGRRGQEKGADIMSKADGVFIFIGTYASEVDARADYEIVKDLHAAGAVGTYDAAVVTKDAEGKVHVNKDETSTRH